jgi:hypothetical protein
MSAALKGYNARGEDMSAWLDDVCMHVSCCAAEELAAEDDEIEEDQSEPEGPPSNSEASASDLEPPARCLDRSTLDSRLDANQSFQKGLRMVDMLLNSYEAKAAENITVPNGTVDAEEVIKVIDMMKDKVELQTNAQVKAVVLKCIRLLELSVEVATPA